MSCENINDNNKIAIQTSYGSIIINLVLALFKLLAGILAHSAAMVSDAVHSASDVFSSIVVILGINMASKESDADHPYGHERFEPVAAIILANILSVTGLLIGIEAVKVLASHSYATYEKPGLLALSAALVSILVKEGMFWYTKIQAKKINSSALMADAWHHRSDALSSIGALVGIIFARFGMLYMDSVASLVICVFIMKAAIDIFRDATSKLVDKSCGDEFNVELAECIGKSEGVLRIDSIQSREFGNRVYVDIEISVDGAKPLTSAHEIAEAVHDSIERDFPVVKHVTVHVNPYSE